MKIKIDRETEIEDVKMVTISVDEETGYRIRLSNDGKSVMVTKVSHEDNRVMVHPCASNQIELL